MQPRLDAPFGELLMTFRRQKGLTQATLAGFLGTHRNTIGRWERGEVLPDSKSIVLELIRHLRLGTDEARLLLEASFTALAPYWAVPFPRNPCFTGRESILQTLHARLGRSRRDTSPRASALSGLGGIGKTQVAVEYAYRHALEYSAVFWLAAETAESLLGSVHQIADQLQMPQRQAVVQQEIVAAVRHWLATHADWLVIADNAEDLELLQNVLPCAPQQGALLLTTRRQALGTLAEPLHLSPMCDEEGVSLLLRRARLLGEQQSRSDAYFNSATDRLSESLTAAVAELVMLLEGLPLALDQAGAYLEETGCSVADYLQRCHQQRKQVLARRGLHGGAHPASVTTTLQLSLARVERDCPTAVDLLRLCAFLKAEIIPEELLLEGMFQLESTCRGHMADLYQFDLALAALRNASLVTRQAETRTLSLHRLVQAVLHDHMEPDETDRWSRHAIRVMNAVFPDGTFGTWAACERFLAHALACVPLIEPVGRDLPDASELLAKVGGYLLARGRLREAEELLQQAVALGEGMYGPEHPALIFPLMKQAELFWSLGNVDLSMQALQRILTLGERHLGPEHLETISALSHLAFLYRKQGNLEQAESMYQRTLCIREQLLGPDHPDTASTLNDLALVYWEQRRYGQAEPLLLRALAISQRQSGPEHPETAIILNNLATLYRDDGADEQAEQLYQWSLRIQEQQLGGDHPDLAGALTNMAILYERQERYEQAECLYLRAVQIRERVAGPEHPDIRLVLSRLANLPQHRRQTAEVVQHEEREYSC